MKLRRAGVALFLTLLVPAAIAAWTAIEEAKLRAGEALGNDRFGQAVGLEGETAVVGAPRSGTGPKAVLGSVEGLAFDPGSGTLYGVDDGLDALVTIDPTTGDGATIGPLGFSQPRGLAYDPGSGTLYGTVSGAQGVRKLVTIDTTTGKATSVGALGFDQVDGLAFDPGTSTLFGCAGGTFELQRLIVIDTATGSSTSVGAVQLRGVDGLAFDGATNTLYGVHTATNRLITIDTATGAATTVGPIGFTAVRGTAIVPGTGVLHGADSVADELIAIDPATAAGAAVGTLTGGPTIPTGSAYVFVRSGTSWVEQAQLTASDWMADDRAGAAVALSGDTVLVGVPEHDVAGIPDAGAVFAFHRSGTAWARSAKLTANDWSHNDRFGSAVALDGDTAVVGAPLDDNTNGLGAGAAYVFVRNGTDWTEQAKLFGEPIWGARFGASVAVEGSTLVIGSPGDGSTFYYRGAAHVFARSGTAWSVVKELHARPAQRQAEFGRSVAISGDRVLVGAPNDPRLNTASQLPTGSAHVYEREGATWKWRARLARKTGALSERFGESVALEGNAAVLGAPSTWFQARGLAYVFAGSGTTWRQTKILQASDGEAEDEFGCSVALSGDTVLVGAKGDDYPGLSNAGSAYVYRISPPPPKSYCTAGTSASGCAATMSVSGIPSATAPNGFFLDATNVEGGRPALFLYGTGGKQAEPWGNGTSFLCLVPPVHRAGPRSAAGTPGTCDGTYSLDLNALWCPTCPNAQQNPGERGVAQAQLWYRDPFSTSNQTSGFSDAVEFWIGP